VAIINIKNLDILFGKKQKKALNLLDKKHDRVFIKNNSDVIIGVNNANLEVRVGEIFVLMGLSGSGKSTLLRSINGLIKPARGSVTLSLGTQAQNIIINACSSQTLRRVRRNHISMVFQNFALLPWRSVEQNTQLGLEIAYKNKKYIEQKVSEVLSLVGLYEWRHKFPHELSGGMKQRVGLARALATDAEILLMDEPFSALDPIIRSQLQEEICRLQADFNKTVVFVSHDFEEALRIGTRIAIMNEGCVLQVGSARDILESPCNSFVENFIQHARKA
jgi:glycine betaine/proline transport system ATP-binding protein